MVFVIYTQRGNQLLHYNLLCLLLYPFWGLETTLCHRTHWSPDFLWIRVALVWFYSKFMIIWIKGLKIRYTLMLHSNAIISGLSRGAGFFGGNHDTRWGNRLHCMAENPLPLPNFKVWPKQISSATSAQIFRFLWFLPLLGVRSPCCSALKCRL